MDIEGWERNWWVIAYGPFCLSVRLLVCLSRTEYSVFLCSENPAALQEPARDVGVALYAATLSFHTPSDCECLHFHPEPNKSKSYEFEICSLSPP